jgi:hypothetical protein
MREDIIKIIQNNSPQDATTEILKLVVKSEVKQLPPSFELGGNPEQWVINTNINELNELKYRLARYDDFWEWYEGEYGETEVEVWNKFEKQKVSEQGNFNRVMDDYGKEMTKYHEEIERNNTPILNAIKEENGQEFYDDLEAYMQESEVCGAFKIVTEPRGEKQEEGGIIEFVWVDQRSVGDSGDSWEGTITVKISEVKYLEMPFSM